MSASSKSQSAFANDVAELRDALSGELEQYPSSPKCAPHLVLLSGLPGTGKSHFARELSLKLPFVIVGSDRMRKALVPRPKYNRSEHARVFEACHGLIEQLLQEGYRVIFDATNLTDGFRDTVYRIAERNSVPLTILWFTAPREVIRQRMDDRGSGRRSDSHSDADWQVYCRLRPGEEPIGRSHIEVDSSRNIAPALEEVLRRVEASSADLD